MREPRQELWDEGDQGGAGDGGDQGGAGPHLHGETLSSLCGPVALNSGTKFPW